MRLIFSAGHGAGVSWFWSSLPTKSMILDSIRGPLYILPVISGKQIANGYQVPFGYGVVGPQMNFDRYVLAPWPLHYLIRLLR